MTWVIRWFVFLPIPAITGAVETIALVRQAEPLFAEISEQRLQEFTDIDRQFPSRLAVFLCILDCLALERFQHAMDRLACERERRLPVKVQDSLIAYLGLALVS